MRLVKLRNQPLTKQRREQNTLLCAIVISRKGPLTGKSLVSQRRSTMSGAFALENS